MPQQQPGPNWQPGPHQQYPPGPHHQQFPPGPPPFPPNQAPRKPGPGRWIALAAIVVVVVAGTIVGVNYFGGDGAADAAGGNEDSSGANADAPVNEPPLTLSEDFLLTDRDEELPASSYGGTLVYDACALVPIDRLTELGLVHDLGGRREALDADVPAEAVLEHSFNSVSFCSRTLTSPPLESLHVNVYQEPYVERYEIDRRLRVEGEALDVGSGMAGRTWEETTPTGQVNYYFLVERPEAIVQGRFEIDADAAAEGIPELRAQLAQLVAEGLAEDPVRKRHGHIGYEGAPAPCTLLSPEVFAATYGTPYSAPPIEFHYGHEDAVDDAGELSQVYVESHCTRESDHNAATPETEINQMYLKLHNHQTEGSARRGMAIYCDPDDPARERSPSLTLDKPLGDEACVTNYGRTDHYDLVIRVGTSIMIVNTPESESHTEAAPVAEILTPIGELIVAGM
ncbi:hypothetical protein [Actinoalloteichus hymeniacidonis]|nr:hypothetical protein [Actinoalloteichus hymeniacidonis]MBB5911063.1 hypothetical protein [Actinoalloteichus hymeniacidonis]